MSIEKKTVREFTEDDWMLFAGAECWEVGLTGTAEPLSTVHPDGCNWTAVADANGIEVHVIEGEPFCNVDVYNLPVAFPTQKAARLFLAGMLETLDDNTTPDALAELGFREIC